MAEGRRIAVTGYDGRLGSKLVEAGYLPMDCDITNQSSILKAVREINPDVIINCAAYTDVDEAEGNFHLAFDINRNGVLFLRSNFDGWLIQMSTDYVFGGLNGPYPENRSLWGKDMARGAYGRSKALGELVVEKSWKSHTIIRTTILYGHPKYPDFVTKVLDQLRQGMPFFVPTNLIGSPTYIPHLVEGITYLIDNFYEQPLDVINIAGSDVISRYDFALMIASVWGYDKQLIKPDEDGKYLTKTSRPAKAGLKVTKAKKKGFPIHSVIEGLEAMKRDRNDL